MPRYIDAEEALEILEDLDPKWRYLPSEFKEFVLDECSEAHVQMIPPNHGPQMYIEYRNGKPHAYRFGPPWVATQLYTEGGFATPEEAIQYYYDEKKENRRK